MRKRRWQLIGVVAAALGALAFGAGWVLAGDDEPGPGQPIAGRDLVFLDADDVDAPAVPLAGAAAKPKPKPGPGPQPRVPKLVYLETDPRTLAPGPTGFRVGNCPKRSKAINGYYFINGTQSGFGLVNEGDSPIRGLKQWAFYLDGGEVGVANVTFGLICLQNVN